MIRKISMALMLGLALSARAQSNIGFSYASPDQTLKCWGTGKAETYNVAIRISDSSLDGMKVTGLEVPMPCTTATECHGFITRELKTETIDGKKYNVVDVRKDATIEDRTLKVTFDEPWVIDGDIYVGYSISVPEVIASDEYTSKPIVYTQEVNANSFYLYSSRTWRTWEPRNVSIDDKGMCSPMKVFIDGSFPENSVGIFSLPNAFAKVSQEIEMPLTIINHGSMEITGFDYEYDINGKKGAGHRDLTTPLPGQFKATAHTSVTLPAIDNLGEYPCKLTITKINGITNDDPNPTAENVVSVVDFVPVNRPLVEEFTGLTCGWCPKGFVAMEYMNEKYGDDFIGIAYHCYTWDPMCMKNQYPGLTNALPAIRINRSIVPKDPYFGNGNQPLGIVEIYDEAAAEAPAVALSLTSDWLDEDRNKLEVTSYLSWAMLPAEKDPSKYRIEYILVADGLEDPSWAQSNYLAGEKAYAGMPGLDEFVNAGSTVKGLVYNDVPVLTAGDHVGVKGSVDNIELYKAATHSYTFDLTTAFNYEGKLIPFNKDNLKVVAFLLYFDPYATYPIYGRVLNACKAKAGDKTNKVESLLDSAEEAGSVWYDLNGRAVANPQKGVYIKVTNNTDGSRTSRKVMIP